MSYTLLEQYVRTLRKPAKKQYAIAYWRYLNGYSKTEPDRGELTYMGAQAIRMELSKWPTMQFLRESASFGACSQPKEPPLT